MKKGIRCESLGMGKKIFISDEYKFSTDTVLLSDFCTAGTESKILDIGTGCGTIPLILCRDGKGKHITAVDIQKNACELLEMSIKANGLEDKISVLNEDVRNIGKGEHRNSYDAVVCNPPYKKSGSGLESKADSRKIARNECMCTIDDIIVAAWKVLRDNGELFMCFRVERMNELLCKMSDNRIEPKILRLVQQSVMSEPKLFLVKGKKLGRPGMRCMPTLIMNDGGSASGEIKRIYKPFFENSGAEEGKN